MSMSEQKESKCCRCGQVRVCNEDGLCEQCEFEIMEYMYESIGLQEGIGHEY